MSVIYLFPQSKELVKAYPPFVNFFEMSKETIVRCEKQKPRFHAFLKVRLFNIILYPKLETVSVGYLRGCVSLNVPCLYSVSLKEGQVSRSFLYEIIIL